MFDGENFIFVLLNIFKCILQVITNRKMEKTWFFLMFLTQQHKRNFFQKRKPFRPLTW